MFLDKWTVSSCLAPKSIKAIFTPKSYCTANVSKSKISVTFCDCGGDWNSLRKEIAAEAAVLEGAGGALWGGGKPSERRMEWREKLCKR